MDFRALLAPTLGRHLRVLNHCSSGVVAGRSPFQSRFSSHHCRRVSVERDRSGSSVFTIFFTYEKNHFNCSLLGSFICLLFWCEVTFCFLK